MAPLKASDIISLIDSLAEAKIEQYQDFSSESVRTQGDLLSLMRIKTQLDLLDGLLQVIDILQDSQLREQDIKNIQDRIRRRQASEGSAYMIRYSNLESILKKMCI